MKVICVDNMDVKSTVNLTINKWYEVINFLDDHQILIVQYLIKNDRGDNCYYRTDRFMEAQEYRKLKLKKLNENKMHR